MKHTLTSATVIVALLLNLALGNAILLLGSHMRWETAMHAALSIGAVVVLLAGFTWAERLRKGWQAALAGLGCTLITPIVGFFLLGLVTPLQEGGSPGEALGKGLVSAILFGGMGGWWFTPPFFLINMPAFYLHWCLSKRKQP